MASKDVCFVLGLAIEGAQCTTALSQRLSSFDIVSILKYLTPAAGEDFSFMYMAHFLYVLRKRTLVGVHPPGIKFSHQLAVILGHQGLDRTVSPPCADLR